MQSLRGGWIRRTAVGATLTTLALLAGLLASSAALAAPDPLAPSSSVALQLKNFSGIKVKPKTLNLAITRGELDPTTGAGTIETTGKFTARRSGRKTKVKVTALVFGANGGRRQDRRQGRQAPDEGLRQAQRRHPDAPGIWRQAQRGDREARLEGREGAEPGALPRQREEGERRRRRDQGRQVAGLGRGQRRAEDRRGAARRDAGVRGRPLFGIKLANHCVNGRSSSPAASSRSLRRPSPCCGNSFFFPVTGGSIAPDFSSGRVTSAGGQKLTKNDHGPLHWLLAGCAEARRSGPPSP